MRRKSCNVTTGHDQLGEFLAMVDDHKQRADERHTVVNARIAELESELASLKELRERIADAAA